MRIFTSSKLLHFMTTIEEGSITKASEKLHLTRTPVSKTISDIEHSIKKTLFNRDKNGLQPNTDGEELYNLLLPVYRLLLEIDKNLMSQPDKNIIKILFDCRVSRLIIDYIMNFNDLNQMAVEISDEPINLSQCYDSYINKFDIIISTEYALGTYNFYKSITLNMTAILSRSLVNNKKTKKPISIYRFNKEHIHLQYFSDFNWMCNISSIEKDENNLNKILFSLSNKNSIAIMPELLSRTYQISGTECFTLEGHILKMFFFSASNNPRVDSIIQFFDAKIRT